MADPSTGSDPEKDADRAAAEWLLKDDPAPLKREEPVIQVGGESFELADVPAPAKQRSAPLSPEWDFDDESANASKSSARGRSTRAANPSRLDAGPAVDPVWTRSSEWGGTLLLMLVWAAAVWFAIYVLFVNELYAATGAVLLVGTVVGFALCYPIIITLERPVRMTPEQAIRDYSNALSHHFPHYKRMWLLLSNAGRTSSHFGSYEGFKRYWKAKLKQLREGQVSGSTPLVFLVSDFKSEKSAGKTAIDASWTIQVFIRGRREQGPIWSFPIVSTLAKGPDGMWYLDDGTLADRPATKAAETWG